MIPLYDSIPARRRPFVVWLLVAVNGMAFLQEVALPEAYLQAFVEDWGVVPREFVAPRTGRPGDPPEWLTLVSSQFLHGGWFHLIGNMLFLWVFGDNVEDRLGHGRFLGFYLAAGAVAALGQIAASPGSALPMVGASGAVAGVLGAYLVLYPHAKVRTVIPIFVFIQFVDVPALLFLGYWFLVQLLAGTLALTRVAAPGSEGGVAFMAHVGGFVFGAAVGAVLRLSAGRRRRAAGYRGLDGGGGRPGARGWRR